MELNSYQIEAHKTSLHEMPVIYPVIGLLGEAGEVADKVKKLIRDKGYKPGDIIDHKDKEAIMLELGDVLWYVSEIANNLDITLEEVGRRKHNLMNVEKFRNYLEKKGDVLKKKSSEADVTQGARYDTWLWRLQIKT